MYRTGTSGRPVRSLSRLLGGGILVLAPGVLPWSLSAQQSTPLRFPLCHSESYPSQPALGHAWTGVPFTDTPPPEVPDSVGIPEGTEWGEVRLTPELRLLLVRNADGDRSENDYSVFSMSQGALIREIQFQAPDSGTIQFEVRVPVITADEGQPAGASFPVLFKASPSGRVEYQIGGIWQATLEVDGERLGIGLQRFADGRSIIFSDADADGVYEHYLEGNAAFGLGGRFWTLFVDFSVGAALLSPTDRTPVDVGWSAPELTGSVLSTDSAFSLTENLGHTVVLVFCYQGCFACRSSRADFESLNMEFSGDSAVLLVSVATSPEEATGVNEAVAPGWLQVISPQAWGDYAVSPTPTVFVVGPGGVIVFRRVGGGPDLGPALADEIRKARGEECRSPWHVPCFRYHTGAASARSSDTWPWSMAVTCAVLMEPRGGIPRNGRVVRPHRQFLSVIQHDTVKGNRGLRKDRSLCVESVRVEGGRWSIALGATRAMQLGQRNHCKWVNGKVG